MEKYRNVIKSGLLLLSCILLVYSNWGFYTEYIKNNKEPDIIKKRKRLLIASSVLLVISIIWFIYEIIHIT